MSRIVSLPAGVFAFGLLASSALAAGDTITIGIPVGRRAQIRWSLVRRQASELAVEEINAKGGILGKKVVLEVADDASGAAGAQKAYDLLIFKKKVDAIVAMETSAARNAGLPIVNRGKIPYIYTSFYEGRSCNPYMYIMRGFPSSRSLRSSITSTSRALRLSFDRLRLFLRPRYAGLHEGVH